LTAYTPSGFCIEINGSGHPAGVARRYIGSDPERQQQSDTPS
jgi:hypothetical protein